MKGRLLALVAILAIGWALKKGVSSTDAQPDAASIEQQSVATDAQTTTNADVASAPTSSDALANEPSVKKGMETPHYESSRGGQRIAHVGYTLSYDADYKTPQWVGWVLTKQRAEGTVPREKEFTPDPDVRGAKAYSKDYSGSGYDRGHIAPAGDMKWSLTAMRQSFYTSNICPQNGNLNRGIWKELEELERVWAIRYGLVYITAGPIYRSKRPQRIGANKVAVPDAFFKVLLIDDGKQKRAYGFMFDNAPGGGKLTNYQYTVDDVEAATGMDFFTPLPDKLEERLESAKPDLP